MKLYLISKETFLQERWLNIFFLFKPKATSKLPKKCTEKDMFIIHDTFLEDLSDKDVRLLCTLHVMILSTTPCLESAQKFLSLGARGYGNAMMHESHLLSAYHAILEGNVWLTPDYISLMIQYLPRPSAPSSDILSSLSQREREVAYLLAQGLSHKEISEKLKITVRTIKAHSSAIYSKLNLKDRLALALLLHI